MDMAGAGGEVTFVLSTRGREMTGEVLDQRFRQHGHAIFLTFAVADGQLAPREIEILHSDGQRFQQA
jgi:hypothetical protein